MKKLRHHPETTAVEAGLAREVTRALRRLAKARSRRQLQCAACLKSTPIGRLELRYEIYYVRPYSCSGGDYYTPGDKPIYRTTCPHCGKESRWYITELRERGGTWQFIHSHADAFASRRSVQT